MTRRNGDVAAASSALGDAQEAFAGAAGDFGGRDEEDVQALVDEGRKHQS